jgi:hypothetical protein
MDCIMKLISLIAYTVALIIHTLLLENVLFFNQLYCKRFISRSKDIFHEIGFYFNGEANIVRGFKICK